MWRIIDVFSPALPDHLPATAKQFPDFYGQASHVSLNAAERLRFFVCDGRKLCYNHSVFINLDTPFWWGMHIEKLTGRAYG